ncbi:alpha-L-rhamnosidase C-terminal domain-containing protein [Paenibacillus rhizoplanae]
MNSFNHYAYGAVGDFLYRHVAGIEQTEEGPGYKQFLIQPHPGGGLTSAAASLESMYGTIRSEWTIDSGTIELTAVVPPQIPQLRCCCRMPCWLKCRRAGCRMDSSLSRSPAFIPLSSWYRR